VGLLADISFEHLTELFQGAQYLVPFTVLLLCGLGLPLPEEVTLIGSGLLVYQGRADFTTICLVCAAAILLGDSIPYWLGRRYGKSALRVRWVRQILHPERFEILERRFEAHGNWAIFTCRFLPGIRIPGYFTAGMFGMKYARFILLDALGVAISVPTSIFLGRWFGDSIEKLKARVDNFHQILAFGIISLVLIMVVRARVRSRTDEAKALSEQHEDQDGPESP
jgi:membrane protein DedA with SNARE-associated domain